MQHAHGSVVMLFDWCPGLFLNENCCRGLQKLPREHRRTHTPLQARNLVLEYSEVLLPGTAT